MSQLAHGKARHPAAGNGFSYLGDDELTVVAWKLRRTCESLARSTTIIGHELHRHYLSLLQEADGERQRRLRAAR